MLHPIVSVATYEIDANQTLSALSYTATLDLADARYTPGSAAGSVLRCHRAQGRSGRRDRAEGEAVALRETGADACVRHAAPTLGGEGGAPFLGSCSRWPRPARLRSHTKNRCGVLPELQAPACLWLAKTSKQHRQSRRR